MIALPLVSLTTGISSFILLPVVLCTYAGIAYHRKDLFAGLSVAFFVLLTFNANVPLIDAVGPASLNLYLLDIPLVMLLGVQIMWYRSQTRIDTHWLTRVVIYGLGAFVVWSTLSTVVGNGPSQLGAAFFSIQWFRFLIILLTVTLFTARTSPRIALSPIAIAISGHLVFALAQTINASIFGLSYLGETSSRLIRRVSIGPISVIAGQHAGGFMGTTRVLLGVLILLLPILVLFWTRIHRAVAIVGTISALTIVFVSDSQAGAGAFILISLLLLTTVGWLYRGLTKASIESRSVAIFPVLASIILIIQRFTSLRSKSEPTKTTATGSQAPSTNNPSGGDALATPPAESHALALRLQQYTAGVDVAKEYPLFGLGGANFRILSLSYGLPESLVIHNVYVALLAGTGFPGLLAYLVVILAALAIPFRELIRPTRSLSPNLAMTILVGMIGFHAYLFWTSIYYSTIAMSTFWAVVGIVCGSVLKTA